jgi:LysR family glycine cleavage system transcriptional activator
MSHRPLNNLPLEWIRAFEAAGRNGSFTAAARETGLTQASISQRISHLEHKLGAKLFLRKARGVVLTVDGEAWLPYVSSALTTLQESAQELFSIQRKHFTISASSSVIDLWITPRLNRFPVEQSLQLFFQTMVLEAQTKTGDDLIKIRYGTGDWPDFFKLPMYKEVISPVASPDLLKLSGNWQNLPRIALSGPRPGWKQWIRYSDDSATPIPTMGFDTFNSALAAAKAGQGVLLASLPLCDREISNGQLLRLSQKVLIPQATYWLIAQQAVVSQSHWRSLVKVLTDQHGQSGSTE